MSTDTPPAAPAAPAATEDKTVAILAYITLIGFIVAIIMHGNKKTSLGTFHLRQALGLVLTGFAGGFVLAVIPFLGWALLPFFWLAMIILVIIGIINAVGGKEKLLPVVGGLYAKWFANTFS